MAYKKRNNDGRYYGIRPSLNCSYLLFNLRSNIKVFAKFTVKLITPIAMNEKLNFAKREGGRTVGAGVVTKIVK